MSRLRPPDFLWNLVIHFPPSPKKFLHSYLGCLKSSWSRFKSFYFFSPKITTFGRFRPNVAFWSMFWFKPFRNFLRKITIFRNFDQWSEILSVSDGRPLSQGVCPSLLCIHGNDFIAHWAYEEMISSHTEHTLNEFSFMLSQRKNVNSFYMYSYAEHKGTFYRTLSIRGNVQKSNISAESNMIFKNLVLQALGTMRIRFLQKKFKKMSCLCTFKCRSLIESLSAREIAQELTCQN